MADDKTPKPGPVHVVSPYGELGTVDPEDVDKLVAAGGRVATAEETAEAKLDSQYAQQSTGQRVVGALGGALTPQTEAWRNATGRGLSGGLEGVVVKKVLDAVDPTGDYGRKYAEHVDDLGTAYPTTTAAGETAGIAGGVAIGAAAGAGGPGLLSKALPVNAIGAVGEPIEAGVAAGIRALGVTGEGAIGRAVTTGASQGVRGAVEGALYDATQQVSENVVHDRDLGEKVFAAAGHGALSGLALGAGLGTAGSLAASGGRAAMSAGRRAVADFAESLQGLTNAAAKVGVEAGAEADVLRRTTQMTEDATTRVTRTAEESHGVPHGEPTGARRAPETGESIPGTGEHTGNTVPGHDEGAAGGGAPSPVPAVEESLTGKISDATRRKGYEWAWDATGATKKQATDMARRGMTKAELGETMIRYDVLRPDDGFLKGAIQGSDVDEMLGRAEKALETKAGPRIGELVKQAGNVRVTLPELDATVGKLVEEYRGQTGHEALAEQLNSLKESLYRNVGIDAEKGVLDAPVDALLKQRRSLDNVIMDGKSTVSPGTARQVKQRFRDTIEKLVTSKLEEGAKAVNPNLRPEYQAAKRDYARLVYIRDTLTDSSHQYAGAQRGEQKLATKLVQSAFAGSSLAGPKGAVLGAAATVGKHVLGDKVAPVGAFLLLKASNLGGIASAARAVDDMTSRAARGVFRAGGQEVRAVAGGERAAGKGRGEGGRTRKVTETVETTSSRSVHVKEVQAKAKAIIKWTAEIQANPRPFFEKLRSAADAIAKSDGPKTAQSYTVAAQRALNFIVAYVPQKERRDPLDPRSVPPLTFEEASRLVRAATYASNPPAVWSDLERGKVTPEAVAAAQTFMPETYEEFQQKLFSEVTRHLMDKQRMTNTQRLRVDRLLGSAAGPGLKPETIKRQQDNLASGPSAAPQRKGPLNMQLDHAGFDAVEARKTA